MYQLVALFASLLLLPLTLSAPTTTSSSVLRRAGAPIPRPIDNCTIDSVYPAFPGWGYGFLPSNSSTPTILYSYILSEPYQLAPSEETLLENCLTTCAGYGDPGQCQSVFFAYEFPAWVPESGEWDAWGTELPTSQQAGCVLFAGGLADFDLEQPVVNGTYTYPQALNISCPTTD